MRTKFNSSGMYVRALAKDAELAMIPTTLAADYLGMTAQNVYRLEKEKKLLSLTVSNGDKKWKGIQLKSLLEYEEQKTMGPENENVLQVEIILEQKAKQRAQITYGELMEMLGLDHTLSYHRKLIGEYLGEVSIKSNKENGVLLSSIVVAKNTSKPTEGFYVLAKDLGMYDETMNEDQFALDQMAKVFKKYN